MVYFVNMLAGNGMTRSDVDYIYAGATAARFAALEFGRGGCCDDYRAAALPRAIARLRRSRLYPEYAPSALHWRCRQPRLGRAEQADRQRFLAAYGVPSLVRRRQEPCRSHRHPRQGDEESPDDIGKSYDLFRKIDYFDRSDKVSLNKIADFYKAVSELDPSLNLDVSKLVMRLD